jgi:NO-binding membrane sensor protein with MHYT domain
MSLAFAPELARTALLALSAGVAMLACQVSLDLAQRLRVVKAAVGLRWLLAAALAFGTGNWSVHVLALAAAPPLP